MKVEILCGSHKVKSIEIYFIIDYFILFFDLFILLKRHKRS